MIFEPKIRPSIQRSKLKNSIDASMLWQPGIDRIWTTAYNRIYVLQGKNVNKPLGTHKSCLMRLGDTCAPLQNLWNTFGAYVFR